MASMAKTPKPKPRAWRDERDKARAELLPTGWAPGLEALTDWRDRLFVMIYVREEDATLAARLAYGVSMPPQTKALAMLSRPAIQAAVTYTQRRLGNLSGVTLEEIVGRLKVISDANIGRMVTVDNTGRVAFDLRALAEADWRTIKSLKIGKDGSITIELHDAAKALETLGRHLGMGQGTVRVIQEAREEAAKLAALMSGLSDQELADLQRIGGRIEAIANGPVIDNEPDADPVPEEESPEQEENG